MPNGCTRITLGSVDPHASVTQWHPGFVGLFSDDPDLASEPNVFFLFF